jgi:ribosomal protein S18 acetylase RimI-like enzyme
MSDLPEDLFANPVWHALTTKHRHLASWSGSACRYPADVAPFAALQTPGTAPLQDLRALLETSESVWLVGPEFPQAAGLSFESTLPCLQMVLPADREVPSSNAEIVKLSEADAADMVALTDIAFPGFFRPCTWRMGSYYGVRFDGNLAAMAGERLQLEGYPEISGVCTHPEFRGRGLATELIWHLVRAHRRDGVVSWLHVGSANRHAIDLYLTLGFRIVREVTLHRVMRTD